MIMKEKKIIGDLKKIYRTNKLIKKRLSQFKTYGIWRYDGRKLEKIKCKDKNRCIFEEMCFSILAAGSTAKVALKAVEALRKLELNKFEFERIRNVLKNNRIRFHTTRAKYIHQTYMHFKKYFKMKLEKVLIYAKENLRYFFMNNVKGFGPKEASHFLRNTGYTQFGILDKHILKGMKETGIIKKIPEIKNIVEYVKYEKALKKLSHKLKIPFDALDLVIWSYYTLEVLK